MNEKKTIREENFYVVKGNELIKGAQYRYTVQQLKIFNFLISKIKPNDLAGTWYDISVKELCNISGLDIDSGGTYYRYIKDDIIKLTERKWVKLSNLEMTVSALGDAEINRQTGRIRIKFHEKLEPYLFDLRRNYTQYQLINILSFRSKHAIKLYEIIRSYLTQKKIEDLEFNKDESFILTLEELRGMLGAETYKKWGEFDRSVLKKAENEINTYCDHFRVSHNAYKNGKVVEKVEFIITYPRSTEIYIAHQERRKRLNVNNRESIEKKRQANTTIKNWRSVHPEGTKKECENETKLSKYLINKYWESDEYSKDLGVLNEKIKGENERKQTAEEYREAKEDIKQIMKEMEKTVVKNSNKEEREKIIEGKYEELTSVYEKIDKLLKKAGINEL